MTVSEQALTSLAAASDIISLGMLADDMRRQRHGLTTTFVRVVEVAADPGASIQIAAAAGEVRIAGTPATRGAALQRARDVVAAAAGTPVSAFALEDLEELAGREGVTLRALLEDVRKAGVELIAQASFDRLHDARSAIEAANIAGLTLARLTIEQSASPDPLPTLKAVADLQAAVGVIRAFAPLPRHVNSAVPSTGYDDLKRVALARVVIDNVASIQVDWSRYGPKLAQVALTVGADDIDGVSPLEETTEGRRRAPLEEIRRNIRAAGLEPAERNGRFDVLAKGHGG